MRRCYRLPGGGSRTSIWRRWGAAWSHGEACLISGETGGLLDLLGGIGKSSPALRLLKLRFSEVHTFSPYSRITLPALVTGRRRPTTMLPLGGYQTANPLRDRFVVAFPLKPSEHQGRHDSALSERKRHLLRRGRSAPIGRLATPVGRARIRSGEVDQADGTHLGTGGCEMDRFLPQVLVPGRS